MQRELSEAAALQELEAAAADHMSWLKRVHAALLFRDSVRTLPVEVPKVLQDWVAAPERSPTVAGERQEVYDRLRQARQRMNRRAMLLLERTARGDAVDSGDYDGFMSSVEEYARELRRLDTMLRQSMAETDPLTGVHNRLGMMRDLEREWQRSLRTGQPCCIALVDLDHFKCINDAYGHLAGDKVLRMAARFFVRRLRPYDRVYRYGGEEFLFCLPNADLQMAERVLNRLRGLMARLPVRMRDGQLTRVTASIGVAEMAADAPPQVVLARADAALYAAKTGGRNRVCIGEELCEDVGETALDLPLAAEAAAPGLNGPAAASV